LLEDGLEQKHLAACRADNMPKVAKCDGQAKRVLSLINRLSEVL
jgi:hypothetical protein